MAHQDGRCATDGETIYVSNAAGCSDTAAGAGTAAQPFCTLEPAAKGVSSSRDVVLIRGAVLAGATAFASATESSIVGQLGGSIASVGPNALHVGTGGKLFARDVSVSAVAGVGILAETGSVLRLEHATVANSSKGGIQLSGGAFDISNSTITGNGPGTDGGFFWGGIDIQFPPAGGPARLNLVTVTNNKASGIVCSAVVTGTGVLASGNSGGDVGPSCGFSACAGAGATCGAQP
jgi:hypothetical protein